MTATRNSPAVDQDYLHIRKTLFDGKDILDAFKDAGITSLLDLHYGLNDAEIFKKMKFKNGDDTTTPRLSDRRIEELKFLRSYLNWEQNKYATLPDNPFDITRVTRQRFEAFLMMSPTARQGNTDGTVDVDWDQCLESEKRNKIGAFKTVTPTAPTGSSGGSNSTDAATALATFNKKLKGSSDTGVELENAAEWRSFKIMHLAEMELNDTRDLTQAGYKPPDPATAHPDEVALYRKKNVLLYVTLMKAIQTTEGKTIVRKHADTLDGIKTWTELVNHYDQDMSAQTRTKYLFNLIIVSHLVKSKAYAMQIEKFRGWVSDHNHFCETKAIISSDQELVYMERFISTCEELVAVKKLMDVQEDTGIGTQAVTRTAEGKMAFYYRQAQDLDASIKTKVIESRRKANMGAIGGYDDEMESWDNFKLEESGLSINQANLSGNVDESIEAMDGYYEVFEGRSRRTGHILAKFWKAMSKEEKTAWLSMSIPTREMILTHLIEEGEMLPPPPTGKQDHKLPGTPIAKGSRATNIAESATEDDEADDSNTSERAGTMSIIGSMQERRVTRASGVSPNSLKKTPPFVPGRLMSSQNNSSTELVPILKNSENNPAPRRVHMTKASTIKGILYDANFPDLLSERRAAFMAVSTSVTDDVRVMDGTVTDHSNEGSRESMGLMDGGANCGLGNENDLRLLSYAEPERTIVVTGHNGTNDRALKIGTLAAKVTNANGESILIIMHEFGVTQTGPTILSKIQLLHAKCKVDDVPYSLGGTQCITSRYNGERQIIPMIFQDGLAYIKMEYPTNDDLRDLPMVQLTRDQPWDPRSYDRPYNLSSVGELRLLNHLEVFHRSEPVQSDTIYYNYELQYDLVTRSIGRSNWLAMPNGVRTIVSDELLSTNPFDDNTDESDTVNYYLDDVVQMTRTITQFTDNRNVFNTLIDRGTNMGIVNVDNRIILPENRPESIEIVGVDGMHETVWEEEFEVEDELEEEMGRENGERI